MLVDFSGANHEPANCYEHLLPRLENGQTLDFECLDINFASRKHALLRGYPTRHRRGTLYRPRLYEEILLVDGTVGQANH